MKQKFVRGDMVHVAKEMPPSMAHFENDFDAIIIGSYSDLYGGSIQSPSYSVLVCKDGNEIAWYDEHQLTFIRHCDDGEVERIKAARQEREAVESDMAWILANWPKIRLEPPGATMSKLMAMLGIKNPWGSNGEGYVYAMNAEGTFKLLDEALLTGDMKVLNDRIAALTNTETKTET